MKKLMILLFLLPIGMMAQEMEGTYFEHELSWSAVKEKAKKENKYLLLDCFATWCAPCKEMAEHVFPDPKVGAFLNNHFINVKVQHDRTANDSEMVKKWYKDADFIAKEYGLIAYPTFLIFSPAGELVHRIVGEADADGFIAKAKMALQPETQYHTLLRNYQSGDRLPERLKNLATAAMDNYDPELAATVTSAYLATQNDPYTKQTLELLVHVVADSKSPGFSVLLRELEKADAILGEHIATRKITGVIMKEEVHPHIPRSGEVNLDSLKTVVAGKFPNLDIDQPFAALHLQLLEMRQDWERYCPAVLAYIKRFGGEVTSYQLMSFARAVLMNVTDTACISDALVWSKRSVDETASTIPFYIDVYAGLLYKTGDTEQAMVWQQKAVDLEIGNGKTYYLNRLERMKKGKNI